MRMNKNRNPNLKIILPTIIVAILGLGTWYYFYAQSENMWPFVQSSKPSQDKTTGESSTLPSAVEGYVKNGGGSQDNSNTQGSGVTDTGGEGVTEQPTGVKSASGNITLYSPRVNQVITGQVSVSGAADVPEVFYRINDNVSGMIGSGRLTVHGGYFSGTLAVTTNADSGSFEVYSFNSQGQEINNISVAVKY